MARSERFLRILRERLHPMLCRQWILLLLIASITKQQDSFYFDPAPINQDVLEGESVRLRCDVSNRRLIVFYWTLNNRQLANTSRRFQENSDLRILWVDRALDGGSLRCIATNVTTGIALRSAEAKLNILWISKTAEVQLKTPKEHKDIAESGEVVLRCAVEGNPEPNIDWYRNKIRLFPSEHVKFLKGRLRLVNATVDDNGLYSCTGYNVAGQLDSTDNFLLNIRGTGFAHLKGETFVPYLLVRRLDSALFNCEFDSAFVSVEWHFEQQRLTESSRHAIFRNGSLLIRSVDLNDVGFYRCVGSGQTFAAELRLAYLDDLTEALINPTPSVPQVIPVNGKLDIRCHRPNGLPTPTLRWFSPYNTEVLETDMRIRAVDEILSLSSVEEKDGGNYTCQASNVAATRSLSVYVIVSVVPKISRPPLSTRVSEGEMASFDCKVTATPFPVTTVSWIFEDAPLKNGSGRMLVDERLAVLRISEVHLTDEGNYACVVRSKGHPDIISANAHLYVEKQLKFKPKPMSVRLDLGVPGKISCHAEGRTIPSINWLKNGDSNWPSHVHSKDGALHFQTVRYSDAGNYTCIASNDQGTIDATFRVDIVVKPRFQLKPMNLTVKEASNAMFHCVATGDPTPSVQWDRNNRVEEFISDRIKVLTNGSLQVSPTYIEDSGMYGCTAGSSAGLIREEVFLRVLSEENFNHYLSSEAESQSSDGGFSITTAIIISICCVAAYLTIVIGLTVYCSLKIIRNRNLRAAANVATAAAEQTGLMSTRDSSVAKGETDTRSHISGTSSQPSQSSHSNPSQVLMAYKAVFEKYQFSRNQLLTVGLLGKCSYGDVCIAKAYNLALASSPEALVMVKSFSSQDERHQLEAKADLETYSVTNHQNVVRLIGICKQCEPILAIYEYPEWGSLKQFLQASLVNSDNFPQPNYVQKLTMCLQVSQGMEHISKLHLVHKDLAARNILIAPNFDVKIAKLGLCRDTSANEYFLFHQDLIPLRWMPPEAVFEDKYTASSDVWSYAVFIWEVFSQACLPYLDRSNEEVLRSLKAEGNKLNRPAGFHDGLWTLVEKCTQLNASARPTFSDLVDLVSSVLKENIV